MIPIITKLLPQFQALHPHTQAEKEKFLLHVFPLIRKENCSRSLPAVSQFSCSVVSDSATPWTPIHQASLSITNSQSLLKLMSITNSQSLLKLMSITSVMLSNHLIPCCPLLLPSVFPSIRIFSNELVLCISWPKYWSFSFRISLSNEHSGLISFTMDWLDLLAVQGTLKSLVQHHSSKASILWHSAFFMVQFSYPYMNSGKTVALM